MDEKSLEKKLPIWEVGSFRLSAFVDELEMPDLLVLFKDVSGVDAEKDENDLAHKKRTLFGASKDLQFSITKTPQRIDAVIFQNPQIAAALRDPLPHIGDIEDTADLVRNMSYSFIKSFKNLKRYSVGGVYLLRQQDAKTAYSALASYLPNVKIDLDNSSDLLYRVNRPKTANLGESTCPINRVSTWSVIRGMGFNVALSGKHEPQQTSVSAYAVRVDTDINTVPAIDLTTMGVNEKLALADVLYQFSIELPLGGDV